MINRVVLTGRLTADPELKKTANGTSVLSATIAIDRRFADKQTGERQTDFINIVAWRTTADFICKYFRKGELIGIDGELQSRKYEDKAGNKRTAVEVVVENASFLESKKSAEAPEKEFTPISKDDFDEDLPF